MDAQKDPRGQLLTDRNLNVLSDPSGHSYALGDCANIIDMPLPATAQVMQRICLSYSSLLNHPLKYARLERRKSIVQPSVDSFMV